MGPRRDLEMPVRRNARTLTLWSVAYIRDSVGGRSLKTEMFRKGRQRGMVLGIFHTFLLEHLMHCKTHRFYSDGSMLLLLRLQ